jgi:hypothetical protein
LDTEFIDEGSRDEARRLALSGAIAECDGGIQGVSEASVSHLIPRAQARRASIVIVAFNNLETEHPAFALAAHSSKSLASCPWQQPAGITLHDGMKLWGVERRLDQLQEGCLHWEIGSMRTEDDSFDGDAG